MKSSQSKLPLLLLVSLAAGSHFTALANNPDPNTPAMVEIEAQLFNATDAQVRSALKNEQLSYSIDEKALSTMGILEHADKAVELLTQAGADFFSSPRLITKNGQRGKIEAVRELKYPSNFEVDPKTSRVIPTTFETRNVGVTIELESVIGPGDILDINVEPSVVSFLGFIDYSNKSPKAKYGQLQGKDGIQQALEAPVKSGGVWQPIFSSSKMTTSVSFRSGQTFLLGGMFDPSTPQDVKGLPPVPTPKHPQPKRLMFILLTARVIHN